MTAIATIRPASFDVLLAPERQAAVAAVASLHTNRCFIDELHFIKNRGTRQAARTGDTVPESRIFLSGPSGPNADELAVLRSLLFELHVSVFLREQRVIAAAPDIAASVKTRAALAHDDVTCQDGLATVDFHAETLAL